MKKRTLTMADLDSVQVERMRSVYGMSDASILQRAQQIIDPSALTRHLRKPSRRGKRFINHHVRDRHQPAKRNVHAVEKSVSRYADLFTGTVVWAIHLLRCCCSFLVKRISFSD